jgi:predicted double-glycine peptidase
VHRKPAILLLITASLLSVALARPAAAAPAPAGVLLDVPFVRQSKNGCGAASLSMLLHYWEKQQGEAISPRARESFIEQTLDPHRRGIVNTDMEAYLRDSGFRVFAFAGHRADLRENLSQGRPLIVALGPSSGAGPLHYVVVAGIDWARNFVFLNDPAQRKLFRMTRDQFTAEWQATGRWTLLAVPQLPE